MAMLTELKRPSDWLRGEQLNPPLYSRDEVLLLSSGVDQKIATGTVLGQVGSGGWTPLNLAASDGSQNAAAILFRDTVVPAGVDTLVTVVAREASITANALGWPAGISSGQIATALAQLKLLGFIVRAQA